MTDNKFQCQYSPRDLSWDLSTENPFNGTNVTKPSYQLILQEIHMDPSQSTRNVTSIAFDIVKASAEQSNGTTASTPAATSLADTPASSSPNVSSESVVNSSGALSSPAKIGLGVGIGLGIPILAAVIAGAVLLMRRKKGMSSSFLAVTRRCPTPTKFTRGWG